MAVYKVGQLVKIVDDRDDPTNNGHTGRITGIYDKWAWKRYWWERRWPRWHDETCYTLSGQEQDDVWVAAELAPIQDDGLQVVKWSECAWQPLKETA